MMPDDTRPVAADVDHSKPQLAADLSPLRPAVSPDGRPMPAWATDDVLQYLRYQAVLNLFFDTSGVQAGESAWPVIRDSDALFAFLTSAPSGNAATNRLAVFQLVKTGLFDRDIALAAQLCSYIEEGVAA